jgi:hypothetical protein
MPAPPPIADVRRSSAQFSMRSMLIAVTCVAILAALSGVVGLRMATSIAVYILALAVASIAPFCLGALALYSRGPRQTFFLGAFVGSVIPLVAGRGMFVTSTFDSSFAVMLLVVALNVASAVSFGWLALATRRFAERRGWDVPPNRRDSENRD